MMDKVENAQCGNFRHHHQQQHQQHTRNPNYTIDAKMQMFLEKEGDALLQCHRQAGKELVDRVETFQRDEKKKRRKPERQRKSDGL
ncbi:hypothetical protein MGYG_04175 [Nannizzia gypsea CBS 118893]|uniref:Uncharacterized protein n=1 Tax=Arthroderma gypseum (strain ATCC MYA-4604 / CBS 118893) TaxID=535722 RepID=E4UV54_ARTGP|nr:hypothetical protein MGYG_04175 [Nannizzia gypsea CBS 118893]EFR01171.1 hypothetical protein MGYG_04175 [Nannizzia gypsea CBS 118893]